MNNETLVKLAKIKRFMRLKKARNKAYKEMDEALERSNANPKDMKAFSEFDRLSDRALDLDDALGTASAAVSRRFSRGSRVSSPVAKLEEAMFGRHSKELKNLPRSIGAYHSGTMRGKRLSEAAKKAKKK